MKQKNRFKLKKKAFCLCECQGLIHSYSNMYNHRRIQVCLTNVKIEGIKSNHVWVSNEDLYYNFLKHDLIQFYAIVKPYTRKDGSIGFGLSGIRDIQLIKGVC